MPREPMSQSTSNLFDEISIRIANCQRMFTQNLLPKAYYPFLSSRKKGISTRIRFRFSIYTPGWYKWSIVARRWRVQGRGRRVEERTKGEKSGGVRMGQESEIDYFDCFDDRYLSASHAQLKTMLPFPFLTKETYNCEAQLDCNSAFAYIPQATVKMTHCRLDGGFESENKG